MGKNGPFWLTVPIAKDSVKLQIDQVLLPSNDWRQRHLKTITETYKKRKNFFQLENLLTKWFLGPAPEKLSNLNQTMISDICKLLKIKTKLINSNIFPKCEDKITRILIILESLGATTYITGPSAVSYIKPNLEQFRNKNIAVAVKEYGPYQSYPQVALPFNDRVSIIDLISNCAPGSLQNYLISTSYIALSS
jgi:hypothetical protein